MRVLVVDDSVLFRRVVGDTLAAIPGVEVVGTANTGRMALTKIEALFPDIVTLDIEMPEMDGIAVLEEIKARRIVTTVIVVSAMTPKGGQLTMKALELGAFDFITKPAGEKGAAESQAALAAQLGPVMRSASHRVDVRNILRGGGVVAAPTPSAPAAHAVAAPTASLVGAASGAVRREPPSAGGGSVTERMARLSRGVRPAVALIGVSTGGPVALATVVPGLPKNLPVPVLIVQHMPPMFTQALATSLSGKSAVRVKEAEHGETAVAGCVYIAPGGRHMKVQPGPAGEIVIRLTDEPPENNCRPAVDYLFRSVSLGFPGRAVATILTGMGRDGTLGLQLLKRGGCATIAQDEATSVVFGMPKEAIAAGVIDVVAPLDRIAGEIVRAVTGVAA